MSVRDPFPHWQPSYHCHLTWQKEPWDLCRVSFKRTQIPFIRAPPSWPHLIPVTFQRSHFLTSSQWGLGFQYMSLGRDRNIWSTAGKLITETRSRNMWGPGRKCSNWSENFLLETINHQSMRGRVPEWPVMSDHKAGIYHFEYREVLKEYMRQSSTEVRMLNPGATANYLSEFFNLNFPVSVSQEKWTIKQPEPPSKAKGRVKPGPTADSVRCSGQQRSSDTREMFLSVHRM